MDYGQASPSRWSRAFTSPRMTRPEVTIDPSLVRALLQEQHADLAQLALIDIGEGWDNKLFRLGDALAVRLPRRAASAALIEHEQRWLPRLSPRLPLPVPVPLRVGRPGSGFPWSWSVVPWFAGESALVAPPQDPAPIAATLAQFLRALHQPAPEDAPHNPGQFSGRSSDGCAWAGGDRCRFARHLLNSPKG